MRKKLSAKYGWGTKIPPLFLLSIMFLVVYLSYFGHNMGWIHYIIIALAIFLLFKGIDFVYMENIIIEFDTDNVYITHRARRHEESVPLQDVMKLNMRPSFVTARGYNFYRLTFLDQAKLVQQVGFPVRNWNRNTKEFVALVKSKNPEFIYKNWTHTLDFKE